MPEQPKKIFTLLQLLQSVSRMIAKTYEQSYWIKAEITKINEYKYSGHCYPELVAKQNGKIVAQIRAIIWEKTYQTIKKNFETVTKEPLKEGMTVVLLAQINFDPLHGISLIIKDIDPSYTLGDMMRERNAAIECLKKEGIFGKNKLLKLSLLPRRLAVISVMTSKGFQDFNNVLSDFQEKYKPFVGLFPALLQGDRAVESMMSALEKIRQHLHLFDAVLILRGGGSDIGLNAYDSYEFAAAIATFPLPVITGIGHSTNETVVEMVAWKNMITPTETAYFLISRYAEFENTYTNAFNFIIKTIQVNLAQHQQNLNRKAQQLKTIISQQTQLENHALQSYNQHINLSAIYIIENKKNAVGSLVQKVPYIYQNNLERHQRQLSTTTNLLLQLPKMNIQDIDNKLYITSIKAQSFNPDVVLQKGFSLTKHNNHVVKDILTLQKGDNITTYLKAGKITSIIKNIIPYE